ncbi:MAG: hypothetical protein WCN95_08425 [bacterium]
MNTVVLRVIVFSLGSALAANVAWAAGTPFTEEFQTGTLTGNGWVYSPGGATLASSTKPGASGNACTLRIVSPDFPVSLSHSLADVVDQADPLNKTIWADFYAKPVLGEAASIPGQVAALFYFDMQGRAVAYDGATAKTIDNEDLLVSNVWSRFTVRMNYASKKWDLWVNGTNTVSQFGFYTPGLTTISSMTVIEGSGNDAITDAGKSYIDDINVAVDAYPAAKFVRTLNATVTDATTVTLNGELTMGGASVYPTFFWGTADGGATASAWQDQINLASPQASGSFSEVVPAAGLLADTLYYYRAAYRATAGGPIVGWSDSTYVWMAQTRSKAAWQLVSLPTSYGKVGGTNAVMTARVGEALAQGLIGSAQFGGNLFYVQDQAAVWSHGFLKDNGSEPDTWDTTVPTLEVQPGMAFWIYRRATDGINSSTICGVTGPKPASVPSVNFPKNTWKIFGWPNAISQQKANGWGFSTDGNRGYSIDNADKMFVEDDGRWYLLYLSLDGNWHKHGEQTPTTVSLRPGKGYYYFRYDDGIEPTAMTWSPPSP